MGPRRLREDPWTYAGRTVRVRGRVAEPRERRFPNGRFYWTFELAAEGSRVTVFWWERLAVHEGHEVVVVGTFHPWRYNLPAVIELESLRVVNSSGR